MIRRSPQGGRRASAEPLDDNGLMRAALQEARRAGARGEVPVGAVVAVAGRIVARAGNASIATHDATGHAEIRVLRRAGRRLGNYRLSGATLAVTVEPCIMCVGAMLHARIGRLVFGASDPKAGAVVSLYRLGEDARLNHRVVATGGIAAEECAEIVRAFFRARRVSRRGDR